jgi:uncharacterized protein (DUF1697 family)
MTTYLAFLRGVNLGKRQTKSADLKAVFEGLGYGGVKTLISSGNVLFETRAGKGLQKTIETALHKHFGFEIGVVLRSTDALKAMIASQPFVKARGDVALHVLLFAEPMAKLPKLDGVEGDYEIAKIAPDAIYFIVHKKPDGTYLGRSKLGEIDKALPKGALVTMRNWNTIEKAAAA